MADIFCISISFSTVVNSGRAPDSDGRKDKEEASMWTSTISETGYNA